MIKVTLDGTPQTLEVKAADGGMVVLHNSSISIEVSAAVFALIQLPELQDPLKGMLAVALVEAEIKRVIHRRVAAALAEMGTEQTTDHIRPTSEDDSCSNG